MIHFLVRNAADKNAQGENLDVSVMSEEDEVPSASSSKELAPDDPWLKALQEMEEQDQQRNKIGLIINGRYKITNRISFGSYGAIFAAEDLKDKSTQCVAVKFEQPVNGGTHLQYEHEVYQCIQGAEGIPCVHWYGTEHRYNLMVMDLLGPTLDNLFSFCDRQLSVKTVARLGRQMLARLRHLHECGFIHRDIKPENFLIGLGEQNEGVLYLIDYGLARKHHDWRNGKLLHIPFVRGKKLTGTARYVSVNSHRGYELSRRDDLESMIYVLIQLCRKELPWKEDRNRTRRMTKQKIYARIAKCKESMSPENICWGCPPPLALMLRYCRCLKFEQTPDYDRLDAMFCDILKNVGADDSGPFEWQELKRTNAEKLFSFECGFRWVLPKGQEPAVPPTRGAFGFR